MEAQLNEGFILSREECARFNSTESAAHDCVEFLLEFKRNSFRFCRSRRRRATWVSWTSLLKFGTLIYHRKTSNGEAVHGKVGIIVDRDEECGRWIVRWRAVKFHVMCLHLWFVVHIKSRNGPRIIGDLCQCLQRVLLNVCTYVMVQQSLTELFL